MLTDEVKNKFKGLSKEEVLAKMRSSELLPPEGSSKEDKEEFTRLALMETAERDKALFGDGTAASGDVPASSDNNDASKATGTDGIKPKHWWEEDGFEDETKAVETSREARRLNAALQNTIDALNAKEGKKGQETKKMREELETLRKEKEELLKKTQPTEEKAPVRPTRPNPKDYEDGKLDDRYDADLMKYEDDLANYTESMIEYKAKVAVKGITESVNTFKTEVSQKLEAPAGNQGDPLENVFKTDVVAFQKKYGLEMSVDAWAVNKAVLTYQGSSDPEEKARAKKFWDSLTPVDRQKWGKIVKAVTVAYDIQDNVPTPRYKTIDGALFDNGLVDEYKIITETKLTPEQEAAAREQKKRENDGTVSVPPAASAAGKDTQFSGATTDQEKKIRYRDLMAKYASASRSLENMRMFESTPDFKEMVKLRLEITGKVPDSMKGALQ